MEVFIDQKFKLVKSFKFKDRCIFSDNSLYWIGYGSVKKGMMYCGRELCWRMSVVVGIWQG